MEAHKDEIGLVRYPLGIDISCQVTLTREVERTQISDVKATILRDYIAIRKRYRGIAGSPCKQAIFECVEH